ncbi:MAG: MBOAT family protein [Chitinophagaceae bacterium]|nr:MAG: MBOAT family protein [Chitinophagaceae bacterium]
MHKNCAGKGFSVYVKLDKRWLLQCRKTFKYFNFFIDSFQNIGSAMGYNFDFLHLHIILPIGVSFYTFQSLSYTFDIYKGTLRPIRNFWDYATFVSFFPQLVAGPIERAATLIPQVSRKNSATKQQFLDGTILIVYGLFKKVLIGDASGRFVDQIFNHMDRYSSWEVVFACLLFSIQIYADFSGYSNIARGTAKLFGFELMKNFDQPYFSQNITEFWRRWHMSLSFWLRDYLYIALGGNRKGVSRQYINLILTMLIGGLWHGASWTFVIWGGLHGIFLAIHKVITGKKKIIAANHPLNSIGDFLQMLPGMVATYFLTSLAWVFFRAKGMHDITAIAGKIGDWTWGDYPWRFAAILLGFTGITFIFDFFEYKTGSHVFFKYITYRPALFALLAVMFFGVCLFLVNSKPLPFIYFQF